MGKGTIAVRWNTLTIRSTSISSIMQKGIFFNRKSNKARESGVGNWDERVARWDNRLENVLP